MNYTVEIYFHKDYKSIISSDIDEIFYFMRKYFDETVSGTAVHLLLEQVNENKVPNLIYFLNEYDEIINIKEFMDGLHKK